MRLLEKPFQLTSGQRERENRIGKEVDAGALGAVAEWIADSHVQQAQLWIDRGRFPDSAAVALATDPGRTGDFPALIPFVLRHGVEVPEDFAGFRIDCENMPTGNVALAPCTADVEDSVVHLRRRGEPVAKADCGLHVRISCF